MGTIIFNGKQYSCKSNETVLECLVRSGERVNYGCRSGVCQTCLLKANKDNENNYPLLNQAGLSEQKVASGYFLACQTKPEASNALFSCSNDARIEKVPAVLVEKSWLNDSVIKLVLKSDLRWLAGQFLTIWRDDTCARSYSIANAFNAENLLEFQVRHYADGEFSNWLANTAEIGHQFQLQGPFGHCIYAAETEQPLLLVAMGTGLAPIMGVLQDALAKGHKGSINLIVAAGSLERLYCIEKLHALAKQQANLALSVVLPQINRMHTPKRISNVDIQYADIYDFLMKNYKYNTLNKIYICGGERFVSKLQKQLFLEGAKLQNIITDSFIAFRD